MRVGWRRLVLLFLLAICPTYSQRQIEKPWIVASRYVNWSALLTQPSTFVARAQVRLRKRPGGYKASANCGNYVGLQYLDSIRRSRYSLCSQASSSSRAREPDSSFSCTQPSRCRSAVDCYTAPFVRVGNSSKASISLCNSRNLVLDSCGLLQGRRKGTLDKKFPLPAPGAVRLACKPANITQLVERSSKLQWLQSIHHNVWWEQAIRDDSAVQTACAPNSTSLVTTPTLFVMRDRHANYAHELEVVSMAFSFLAALEPKDVAEHGVQVVIVDQAPPTGFLETWARISHPHRLRILPSNPFPPGTCFRSAFHVYTFAAGIGYNTNPATSRCESPVVTGLSNWLRQLYGEGDMSARTTMALQSAAAVAGPAAEAAGVRGLRPPAGGIVLKNVVWLSRRNLEVVRLLLNASIGWKSMRLVRNEDQLVAGMLSAVQEWNAESCLLRRFDRTVKSEYEMSLTALNPVHTGEATAARQAGTAAEEAPSSTAGAVPATGAAATGAEVTAAEVTGAAATGAAAVEATATGSTAAGAAAASAVGRRRLLDGLPAATKLQSRQRLQQATGGAKAGVQAATNQEAGADDDAATAGDDADTQTAAAAGNRAANGTASASSYMVANNIVALERLWELDAANGDGCRRTNVLFKFVDGDFNDMSYHEQLQVIFRTGVLAGVHGAGLTHGFFLQPGQSAVLQLLGTSFAQVAANNVFRNMAAGLGNHYEDVIYEGVDVDVGRLKEAVKRGMDYVAQKVMEAQLRRSGALQLVLVDQSHFSIVVPSAEQCPREEAPAV